MFFKLSGVWCNGSTRPLGGCSPGSNPGTPKRNFEFKIFIFEFRNNILKLKFKIHLAGVAQW